MCSRRRAWCGITCTDVDTTDHACGVRLSGTIVGIRTSDQVSIVHGLSHVTAREWKSEVQARAFACLWNPGYCLGSRTFRKLHPASNSRSGMKLVCMRGSFRGDSIDVKVWEPLMFPFLREPKP